LLPKKCFQNLLLLPHHYNICNVWLEQTYFPGIHFKRIFIRNMLSGPFGTTRNKRKGLKGALIRHDNFSRHYYSTTSITLTLTCYFTFVKWSTAAKHVISPISGNFKECFQKTRLIIIFIEELWELDAHIFSI